MASVYGDSVAIACVSVLPNRISIGSNATGSVWPKLVYALGRRPVARFHCFKPEGVKGRC